MTKCTLVCWPESQVCIGCKNGSFVQGVPDDPNIGDSAYLCFANKSEQDDECFNDQIKATEDEKVDSST